MKVYIAAPYPMREEAIALMLQLETAGHEVTSTWLKSPDEMKDEYARLDLADVARADALVAFNPAGWEEKGTGGRHVEFGYALALNIPVFLIGAKSNIFHHLSHVEPATVENVARLLTWFAQTYPARLRIHEAVRSVVDELERAEAKHKPFNSHHEGYAVIQEEVDELWDDVKADRKAAALVEAKQVAAMGLRFIVNLSPGEVG